MRTSAVFPILVCLTLAACAGTGSSSGGGGGESGGGGTPSGVRAVTGNHQVVIRTWNPNRPSSTPTTAALVNASSDAGKKLRSGKATSTVVRVVTDEQMGALLAALDENGFSRVAAPGVSLDGLRPDAERRGVIVAEHDGVKRGIDYVAGTGPGDLPKVYVSCKQIVFAVHSAVPGFEARASTDAPDDPARVFQAPPARMNR